MTSPSSLLRRLSGWSGRFWLGQRVTAWLPQGQAIPAEDWLVRHRAVSWLLLVHVPGLLLAGLALPGVDPRLAALGPVAPAVALVLARLPGLARSARSAVSAGGLMVCSALLVQLSHGAIEAHFHFFVMIPVIALYEDWVPFGLGMAFVLFEHGVVGTLWPHAVYNHAAAWAHPWGYGLVHATFFTAAGVGSLVSWRLHELSRLHQSTLGATLRYRMRHDRLTGLPNRDWLLEEAPATIGLVTSAAVPLAVLVLDVVRLGEVNDAFGHDVGDRLLVQIGGLIVAGLESEEPVVRLGGDEFAVLLCGERAGRAKQIADDLSRSLAGERVGIDELELTVEVTVGVAAETAPDELMLGTGATAPGAPAEPSTAAPALRDRMARLVRCADVAMNAAKADRRPVVEYDPDADRRSVDRLALLADLQEALYTDQLQLAYQPKVRLPGGELVGVEALLRWTHPVRGPVPPMDFIPAAETTSLVVPLTYRVITLALIQSAMWRQLGLDVRVSVNVPPRCLVEPDFVRVIMSALEATDVPPHLLCLELTETSLMDDPEGTLTMMAELQALGVELSLDDFGTGFSSLSYLRRLPVGELKIDKVFVRGLLRHSQDAILVETTIALAHRLGMTVVAEGVEDDDTARALAELGCDVAQGFLYAKPLPASEVARWVSERRGGRQSVPSP